MDKRFVELDSLRGCFIVSIVLYHLLSIFPLMFNNTRALGFTWFNILKYTPVHIFWAGNEAVIFFFMLSGFVLYLPFGGQSEADAALQRDGSPRPIVKSTFDYKAYLIKRICRIYPPYVVSIVVALAVSRLCGHNILYGLSGIVATKWTLPFPLDSIINHMLLVTYFDPLLINPALWFLVHEMRIVIVFPLIAIFIRRNRIIVNLAAIVALCAAWHILFYLTHSHSRASFNNTIHYLSIVFAGALLAKHFHRVTTAASRLSFLQKVVLSAAGVVLYTNQVFPFVRSLRVDFTLQNLVTAAGIVIFMVLSLASAKASVILRSSLFRFLGKISYGLFLYHGIILICLLKLLYHRIPTWIIILTVSLMSTVAAVASYSLIEKPAARLSKYMVKRFTAR